MLTKMLKMMKMHKDDNDDGNTKKMTRKPLRYHKEEDQHNTHTITPQSSLIQTHLYA